MLQFEILNDDVEEKNGISQKGKPYSIRTQRARAVMGEEVRSVKIPLDRDQLSYSKGKYTVDDSSFYVDGFGELRIRLRLKSLSVAPAKAS